MTHKQVFELEQKAFPFTKKIITIDLVTSKIKIKQKSLFKSDELEIDIDRLNPNVQKIQRWSFFWLALTVVVACSFCLTIISRAFHRPIETGRTKASADNAVCVIYGNVWLIYALC